MVNYFEDQNGKIHAITDMDYFLDCNPELYLRPATYDQWQEQEQEGTKK